VNAVRRGVRNAFRNIMRSVGVVIILGVAIALSISMLIARDAVSKKIDTVRASTGTSITVSPKGFFGFQGGGTPLTNKEIDGLVSLPHVSAVQASLSERLSSSQTNLTSPTPPGFLGQQFGGGTTSSSGSASTSSGLVPVTGGSSSTSSSGFSFATEIRVIGTNSPGTALVGGANGGGTETLTSGKAFSATATGNVAVVGSTLASTNKLSVGSTFTAWGKTITVVGIYNSGSTFANSDVLMPLATVQTLASAPNEITGATVQADSISDVSLVTKEITTSLGSAADVTSTASTVASELAPLNTVQTISSYTLVGAVIGAALILLLSMLMIVRERRREIGVLKALGAPNKSIIAQFIAESTTFTVLGSIVGFVAGIAISSPITSALVNASGGSSSASQGFGGFIRRSGGGFTGGGSGFTPPSGGFGGGGSGFHFGGFHNTLTQLHTSAGWSTLAYAFLFAVVIAVVGSTFATATITRIRPAEVLRSE
jgi:putative ABC transport system permease protein